MAAASSHTALAVVTAFFAVANKLSKWKYGSKWIPAEFWAFLVKKELQMSADALPEYKLRRYLEPYTKGPITDTEMCGAIKLLRYNTKRLKQRRDSGVLAKQQGTKTRHF
jgi:hypothetical protein